MNVDPSAWIKATRSGNSGNCVEMRRSGTLVEVRDSKDRTGPVLQIAGEEFTAWLDAAKQGELDRLA
jgi:hypothetical protein